MNNTKSVVLYNNDERYQQNTYSYFVNYVKLIDSKLIYFNCYHTTTIPLLLSFLIKDNNILL